MERNGTYDQAGYEQMRKRNHHRRLCLRVDLLPDIYSASRYCTLAIIVDLLWRQARDTVRRVTRKVSVVLWTSLGPAPAPTGD